MKRRLLNWAGRALKKSGPVILYAVGSILVAVTQEKASPKGRQRMMSTTTHLDRAKERGANSVPTTILAPYMAPDRPEIRISVLFTIIFALIGLILVPIEYRQWFDPDYYLTTLWTIVLTPVVATLVGAGIDMVIMQRRTARAIHNLYDMVCAADQRLHEHAVSHRGDAVVESVIVPSASRRGLDPLVLIANDHRLDTIKALQGALRDPSLTWTKSQVDALEQLAVKVQDRDWASGLLFLRQRTSTSPVPADFDMLVHKDLTTIITTVVGWTDTSEWTRAEVRAIDEIAEMITDPDVRSAIKIK